MRKDTAFESDTAGNDAHEVLRRSRNDYERRFENIEEILGAALSEMR